jgi:exo-beta-1,3-glucanase (GH17 family)
VLVRAHTDPALAVYIPPPPPPTTTAAPATTAAPTSTAPATVPTPYVTTFSSTGVYTIPATTITITEETTVCGATSTPLASSGTYTVGGVTTIVESSTTVICPYATTTTSGGVVTSTILTTTYVCPSSGTYTIAPMTTTVSKSTVWVYPVTTSYPSGTYTQSAVTTTITESDFVYWCPYATPAPPAPTSTYVPAPAPKPTEATTSVAATSAAAAPTQSVGGTPGNHWAMTYTPYTNSGACKDAGTVSSDIADIAQRGFKTVRVYSTDCSSLQNLGNAAAQHGLTMILGVFISDTGISGAQEQVTQIVQWARWSLVEVMIVGNEAISNGFVSASQLAGFIESSRSAFRGAGYNGPVTTTEPLDTWQANTGALCAAVDVVGANLHPFFNAATVAADAGTFVASQLKIVDSLCPGKTGYNFETGWPSSGICNGLACPGIIEQSLAVLAITAAAGDRSVILSYSDDKWKVPGPFDCEQSWGAIQLFDLIL